VPESVPVKGPTSTEEEPVPLMWGITDVVRVVVFVLMLPVARGVVEAVRLLM